MNWSKLLTACVLTVFLVATFQACGPKQMVDEVPQLDTSLYSKYIVREPDTNLYPRYIHSTSQRYPLEKFGPAMLFDGDKTTAWCSQPGLNCGEGITLDFVPNQVSAVRIWLSDDFTMAKVNRVKVFVNDSLWGLYPNGALLQVNGILEKLEIVAADAEGLNEVKLPVVNDSTTAFKTAYETLTTRYNSRSFGIAELELLDAGGLKMPYRAIPYKEADIACAYITWPPDRFFLFDGNPATGSNWFEAKGMGKLILNFKDYAPITRLRLVTEPNVFDNIPCVQEMGILIAGKDKENFPLKCGENVIDLKEPLVARTFTLQLEAFQNNHNAGSLNEVYAWDGARWYSIVPDSVHERIQALNDTLAGTPFHYILDHRVYFTTRKLVMIADTFKLPSYESVSPDYLRSSAESSYETCFRANRFLDFKLVKTSVTYGENPVNKTEEFYLEGYWRVLERSESRVKLEVRGWQQYTVHKDGKVVTTSYEQKSYTAVIENDHLKMGETLGEMLISY